MTAEAVDMAQSLRGAISSPMVAVLEVAWSAIQAHHPELPEVVIVLGAGSGSGSGLTLGHFAAMRWRAPEPDADIEQGGGQDYEQTQIEEAAVDHRWAEVFIGGEGLARGPADVLATLLHEAAHALAHVRGIKDTSRQGRWHNARFKAVAEEVGIAVAKDPRLGWSPTTLTTAAHAAYRQVIADLGSVLRLHRAVELSGSGVKKPGPPPCVCGCGRKIRVAPSVLAQGPIVCGICDGDFLPEEPDADPGPS
jgi:hypothetical protein